MDQAISRRTFLGAASATAAAGMAEGGPNVLYFFADQVRACEPGYAGGKNIPTPNLDRLASQGVVFTNAISSCPLCTPYRAMVQTGRWPTFSGGVLNWINVPSTGQSMADTFARAGYDTGFIGKWHLAAGARAGTLERGKPPKPGPESEFVPPGPMRMGYRYWAAYNFHANFAKPFYYRDTPQRLYMPGYETDSETDMAMEFMESCRQKKVPFLLTVAPHPPHPPWRPEQVPQGYLERVPKDLYWRPNVKRRREGRNADPRCYYAMLSNVDDNVGRLMKFLDQTGLAENTIVVFTTDHGEMFGSHGQYNKMVPYAEAVDIPLIMRWPGRTRAGSKCDALYTPMDHFPTLASLCGIEVPDIVNGMKLSEQALGRKGKERDGALMMNFVSHWDYPETNTEWPEWRGIRTKQHTYVKWLNGAEELYDNQADPYQSRNLFDGRRTPEVMSKLRSRLRELLEETRDDFSPGTAYAQWLTPDRDVIRTALGPVERRQ